MKVERRAAREVPVGGLVLGGEQPIRVQSMTTTSSRDVGATVAQARTLIEAECELVRVTCPDRQSAAVFGDIVEGIRAAATELGKGPIPVVADIHFNHRLALAAVDAGVDKVRLNPGNIGGLDKVGEVVRAAADAGCAMRIGVNSGSVEADLLDKHGSPTPDALCESALRHLETVEGLGFRDVVVSIKSTDTLAAVLANRLFAAQTDVPLHLGITEAGETGYGSIKSAAGLGSLLLDGIGDTIRVSLTAPPEDEIPVAYDILKACGRRVREPELIACPTCGRIEIDLEELLAEVKERLGEETLPIKISVLGCAVNGPGEALEADIGIAGTKRAGIVYRGGKEVARVAEGELVDALLREIEILRAERLAEEALTADSGS